MIDLNMVDISDLVADIFFRKGIKKVFIYPGGTIMPIINSLIKKKIKIEVFKSEQGAGYAALAWSRITKKPQVVMVTSGPGVTNLMSVIADSYYDSTPLIAITGQIGTKDLSSRFNVRQRGFQEVPVVDITNKITKRSICIKKKLNVENEIFEAFNIATSGRMGPVVIDFPMDIQRSKTKGLLVSKKIKSNIKDKPLNKSIKANIKKIAKYSCQAKRIVLLFGQGALIEGQFVNYKKISELINAHVVTSLMGIGSYDTKDKRFLGYLGHTGHYSANIAVHEADLLIVLGSRLDLRQTGTEVNNFSPNAKIAWIDIDNTEIKNPRVKVNWSLNISVKEFCSQFLNELQIIKLQISKKDALWIKKILKIKNSRFEDIPRNNSKFIQPRNFFDKLKKFVDKKPSIITTGVGCHQQWAARHLNYGPNYSSFLTSGGHGTMGYDLPSSIGAAMAKEEKTIVCIVGDGSFLMNVQELASIAERNLNIKIILLNNQRLGIVSQFQKITWGNDPTTGTFKSPRFEKISKGFNVDSGLLKNKKEITKKLKWLFKGKKPKLLNVFIDPKSDVTPMLLSGQSMNEMWMGEV